MNVLPQVILLLTSLSIVWAEITIPLSKQPDMSLFSLLIHGCVRPHILSCCSLPLGLPQDRSLQGPGYRSYLPGPILAPWVGTFPIFYL